MPMDSLEFSDKGARASSINANRLRMKRRATPPATAKLEDTAWLHMRWVQERMSCAEIAKLIGCDYRAVEAAIARRGWSPRPELRGDGVTARERVRRKIRGHMKESERADVATEAQGDDSKSG